jgi:hypothetical protein
MAFVEATQISPEGVSALTIVNTESIAVLIDSKDAYDMLRIEDAPEAAGSLIVTHTGRIAFFAENYQFWKWVLSS